MIVKSGRLYLWKNDISDKELIIKVGSGSGTKEYVEIEQTTLLDEENNASVEITSESDYENWVNDPSAEVWKTSINGLNSDYLFEDDRKIIFYVKIDATEAFDLGEIGLFVKGTSDTMISCNLMTKQFISTTETKIIKYTINI